MRVCNVCKVEKDLESFHKCKAFPLGRAYSCKPCAKQKSSAWNAANKKRKAENNKKHYQANKQDYLDRSKKSTWAKDNRERVRELDRRRYTENNGAAKVAYYRNLRRRATPPWLTERQKEEIEAFYWFAKDLEKVTEGQYHVDHVVPINGESVCGLHVPWNLQVLPADINIAKSNTFGY